MFLTLIGLLIATALYLFITKVLLPPSGFPRNIPTIPFYVALLPNLRKNHDHFSLYETFLRKPLEEHGAVNFYFAAQWNVLIQRPEYLSVVFQNEDVFAKSGNHEKIPHSVLAQYLGENIISAHGATWRTFKRIMAPGILQPLDQRAIDLCVQKTTKLISQARESCLNSVDILPILQRFAMATVCKTMLGLEVGTLDGVSPLHSLLYGIKRQIFHPLFMTFPFLDRLALPQRLSVRKEIENLQTVLMKDIMNSVQPGGEHISVGQRMVNALHEGIFTETQFQHNATVILVAGHENPQNLLLSILYILGKNTNLQHELRMDLIRHNLDTNQSFLLSSVIYETLRLFPPLPLLINRKTSEPAQIGPIKIPAGIYVGMTNLGSGRDVKAWGLDCNEFRPERWGHSVGEVSSNYKARKQKAHLLAFHGGRRSCLGEKFVLQQTEKILCALLQKFSWRLDPDWREHFTPAGPLSPLGMKLIFEDLS